jgi:hypothetical protein
LEDSSEVVDKSADGNSLVTQASGRGLSDDRITDWADGNHVDESRYDKQNANGELRLSPSRPSETTNRNKTEEHEGETRHVDGGSAEVREEQPTDDTADDVAC